MSNLIWERQSGETEKAYSAFKVYLEMEDRSLQKVTESLQKNATLIRRWASKNDWKNRAAAYDSSIVESTRQLKIAAIKESLRRKVGIADKLEQKALKALEEISINRISGRTIVEMLTLANQLRNEVYETELKLDGSDEAPVIVIKRYEEL